MKQLQLTLAIVFLLMLLGPAAALAQEPLQCDIDYTVQAGDWLSKVADKYFGDPLAFPTIVEANNANAGDNYTNIDNPDLIEPGWLLCIPPGPGSQAAPQGLSGQELANTTYKSEWTQNGTAPLVNGEFSEPAAPGSATMTKVTLQPQFTAYGELNGQPAAAVILVTDPGGSGTFYDLAIVINQNGTPTNVATTRLGDRVQINSVAIENNQVKVDMVQAGPNDALCCPTQQVIKTFALQGDRLVETSSQEVGGGQSQEDTGIVGIVWNWQGFTDQANENNIVVPNPDSYRLELLPDGQFRFKADCNSGSGTYTLDGSSLTLQLGPVTLAECGPGSLYNEYLALLGQVATYVRNGDNLALNLAADAGTMNFSKLQAVTGRVTGPEGATLPAGAKMEIRVDDVSLADVPATQIGGQIIFDVTQFPIEFEAPYDAAAIDPRHTYGLNVRITDSQDMLLYINTRAYNVITRGSPTYNVEVMVDKVN